MKKETTVRPNRPTKFERLISPWSENLFLPRTSFTLEPGFEKKKKKSSPEGKDEGKVLSQTHVPLCTLRVP